MQSTHCSKSCTQILGMDWANAKETLAVDIACYLFNCDLEADVPAHRKAAVDKELKKLQLEAKKQSDKELTKDIITAGLEMQTELNSNEAFICTGWYGRLVDGIDHNTGAGLVYRTKKHNDKLEAVRTKMNSLIEDLVKLGSDREEVTAILKQIKKPIPDTERGSIFKHKECVIEDLVASGTSKTRAAMIAKELLTSIYDGTSAVPQKGTYF